MSIDRFVLPGVATDGEGSAPPSHVRTAPYLLVAGVNKAGTTSLFVSLAAHPGVAPASVKETRYFLPARYGNPLAPPSVYDDYWVGAPPDSVRLEATPAYFYGGRKVAERIADMLPRSQVVLAFREPVSRAISFFTYQKARLRLPVDLAVEDYLEMADRLGPEASHDPSCEPYFALLGGAYADFLPSWLDVLGPDRVRIVFFEDLTRAPGPVLRGIAAWAGLDPDAFPSSALESENRTMGFKSRFLQRAALSGNDRFERFLRRHQRVKRTLRAAYYRVNGRPMKDPIPDSVRAELADRYREPNARLAAQLDAIGVALPAWLSPPESDVRASGVAT